MWTTDPQVQGEIRDAVGEVPITGSDARDPEDAIHTLWGQWIDMTAALQEFGVAPATFCEASNRIVEVREAAKAEGRSLAR